MTTLQRLNYEINNTEELLQYNINIIVDEKNIYKWRVKMHGPKNSPYEDGIFQLSIIFPM